MISTWPICQTAPSPSLTTPGTSALAVVLTPQVEPRLASGEGRQSSGIGKARSVAVAGESPSGPLSWSVMRMPLPWPPPEKSASSVRSAPATQAEVLPAPGKQGGRAGVLEPSPPSV